MAAAGGHHLSPAEEVLDQPQVAAQLVGDDIHWRLEDTGDGRDRARFRTQAGVLRAEGAKVLHHRHAALEERQVVLPRDRLARLAQFRGNPRQPDVQQKTGRVLDQLIVLVRPHEGLLLGRLAVLKTRRGRDIDAGNAIILQADRLRQPGPT